MGSSIANMATFNYGYSEKHKDNSRGNKKRENGRSCICTSSYVGVDNVNFTPHALKLQGQKMSPTRVRWLTQRRDLETKWSAQLACNHQKLKTEYCRSH
jgi:hypothetical protein